MGRLGTTKQVEKLAREARKVGMEVTITGGNHLKWQTRSGKRYYSALSPSDKYQVAKLVKFLKEEGVKV